MGVIIKMFVWYATHDMGLLCKLRKSQKIVTLPGEHGYKLLFEIDNDQLLLFFKISSIISGLSA